MTDYHPDARTSMICATFSGILCFLMYPSRWSRQEESVEMMYSAPVSRAFWTFCWAMAVEIGSFLTEKVPPKPTTHFTVLHLDDFQSLDLFEQPPRFIAQPVFP